MKNGKAGRRIETRRRHVKIVADAYDIRIRIVRVNDRILVRTVTVIGHPNLRDRGARRSGLRNHARRSEREKENRDRR